MKFNPISISWGVWLWLALVVVDQWPCFSYESLSFTVSFMSVSVLSVFCLRTDRRPVGPAQRFVSGAWAIPRKEQKKDVSAMSQGRAHCPQLILQNIARLPPAEKMNRWRFNSKSLVHSRPVGKSRGRARQIKRQIAKLCHKLCNQVCKRTSENKRRSRQLNEVVCLENYESRISLPRKLELQLIYVMYCCQSTFNPA